MSDRQEIVRRLLADPVEFVHGGLNYRTWWTMRKLLRAPLVHDRVAVKSCHKSSKTFSIAALALYWLLRYPEGKVVTTSPVFRQVKKNLWGEIRTMAGRCAFQLPVPNQTDLSLGPKNFAMGVSTDRDVSFAGWSGRILIVIDEAPGVGEAIFDALTGVRAGGRVSVVMLGNPLILGGPYHEAFTTGRSRWKTYTINAFDTPNVRGLLPADVDPYATDDEILVDYLYARTEADFRAAMPRYEDGTPIFPDLARPSWILELWEDEGPGSIDWEARVMGRFPTSSQESIIDRIDNVEATRSAAPDVAGPVDIGVDAARGGGDETACASRRHDTVLTIDGTTRGYPHNIGFVKAFIRRHEEAHGVRSVKVDSAGDHAIFNALRDEEYRFPIHGINVGEKPWGEGLSVRKKRKKRFYNLKAFLWWQLRDRARAFELKGIDDDRTITQLASVRWTLDARGRIRVESKEKLERRGISSPDRAEAVMLAFADPPDRGAAISELKPLRGGRR